MQDNLYVYLIHLNVDRNAYVIFFVLIAIIIAGLRTRKGMNRCCSYNAISKKKESDLLQFCVFVCWLVNFLFA